MPGQNATAPASHLQVRVRQVPDKLVVQVVRDLGEKPNAKSDELVRVELGQLAQQVHRSVAGKDTGTYAHEARAHEQNVHVEAVGEHEVPELADLLERAVATGEGEDGRHAVDLCAEQIVAQELAELGIDDAQTGVEQARAVLGAAQVAHEVGGHGARAEAREEAERHGLGGARVQKRREEHVHALDVGADGGLFQVLDVPGHRREHADQRVLGDAGAELQVCLERARGVVLDLVPDLLAHGRAARDKRCVLGGALRHGRARQDRPQVAAQRGVAEALAEHEVPQLRQRRVHEQRRVGDELREFHPGGLRVHRSCSSSTLRDKLA